MRNGSLNFYRTKSSNDYGSGFDGGVFNICSIFKLKSIVYFNLKKC